YLSSSPTPVIGITGADTIGATITITEDCFYAVDACGMAMDFAVAASGTIKRIILEVLDLQGKQCWGLTRTWAGGQVTAVGIVSQMDGGDIQLRMHLISGMIIRWRLVDAMTSTAGVFSSSIALRKLYQETH